VNRTYDSVDPTQSSGDIQFSIAGVNYPSKPISTSRNKAGVLMDLKNAIGGIHSLQTNNFSINSAEFAVQGNVATTVSESGKFIVGVNVEKISSNSSLLTGISTEASPINLTITSSTPTAIAHTVNLVLLYDVLIEIDPLMKDAKANF
jgi:hypothetical protein